MSSTREHRGAGTDSIAKVKNVLISEVAPNPHNPRRLFDEEPMRILKESIEKLDVLVPITVYVPRRPLVSGEKYVILDGERRWRCVQELGRRRIPAIIVQQPSEAENILTMFHIHNVREGWQLMPTALKLQTLMEKLNERNERNLAVLTKLSVSQIRRCRILLTYPKSIQNLMLAPPSERMKADFFIEMDRIRRPARREKWPPWKERGDLASIRIMLKKYESRVIRAVTEFRYIAEVYRASNELEITDQFFESFDAFLSDADAAVEDILVPGASFAKEAKEIKRSARRLLHQLEDLDLVEIASDEEAIQTLDELQTLIFTKLTDALLIGSQYESPRSNRG